MTTILLVEDAADLALVIQRELETEGYQVIHSGDGLQAVDIFAQHSPDLIILDWLLPGLDGLSVLRQVRARSPVPILMLTARSDEIDRILGLEVGADDYLTKPFSMRELMTRVRVLLRRMERVQKILSDDRDYHDCLLCYRDVRLDPRGFQVSLAGQPLDLTRTEFDLLALFLRNPGRVFSRSYLLDVVWGENYIPGDRSVDNAILRLRKKLEAVGDAIETVWGVGYRLAPEK